MRYHKATSFFLYVVGFVRFILSLRRKSIKYQFGQFTWTIMTNFLFVGQAYFAVTNVLHGLIWIILPHSLIICNDSMFLWKILQNQLWPTSVGLLLERNLFRNPLLLSPQIRLGKVQLEQLYLQYSNIFFKGSGHFCSIDCWSFVAI